MQKSFAFDDVSLQKTLRGFLISLGGALLAGFTMLVPEVNDWIASGSALDWRPAAIAAWGALSSGLVNAAKQFLQGE